MFQTRILSLLFNVVMDHVLPGLPRSLGFPFGGTKIRALAYADDLVLFATSPEGLRVLLDAVVEGLRDCGLELNPTKCRVLSLTAPGKRKVVQTGGV